MKRTRLTHPTLRRLFVPGLVLVTAVTTSCSDNTSAASQVTVAESSSPDSATEAVGDTTSAAATGSAQTVDADELGAVGDLDSDEVHTVSLVFDQADYDAMIATYSETEEKEWIEATVTIDGVTYQRAGIRLKGNSSLRGIASGEGGGAGGGGGGPMADTADPESPETLPWLIKLDKFVDGQNHDGLAELVVRSNNSATSLNEAVALELLSLAGLASQDAVATAFSVNGSDEILRLVIDNPEDEWMAEEFDASGALYKAEAGGDYSYRGDDPDSYTDVFDQEAGKDNTDLTPLIEFLAFINDADDDTFESELGEHLDIDAFATYLAMQDILGNFDDIDGPGNNSYLYYDADTDQFTVVPWDYNLAFGQGPGGGMGGGGGIGGGARPGGDFQVPADGELPADMQLPTGDQRPAPGDMGGGGGFGPRGDSNILVERFLAVDAWNQLYQDRLAELQESLIDSGVAQSVLDTWAAIVSSSGLVDAGTVESESASITQQLT